MLSNLFQVCVKILSKQCCKVKQLKDQNSELSRKKQQLEADKAQVEIDKAEYRENFKTKVED